MLELGGEHLVDDLEYDVLHGGEVEGLHDQLRAVLDVYPQMHLVFVVILHPKHQAEVLSLLFSVLVQEMDKVIEHAWVELLNVLDDEDNGSALRVAWVQIQHLAHAFEGLLAVQLVDSALVVLQVVVLMIRPLSLLRDACSPVSSLPLPYFMLLLLFVFI